MKLTDLLKGKNTIGQLIRKALGKDKEETTAVKRCKKTGRIVTLKSEDPASRYLAVRFSQQAQVASIKRGIIANRIGRVRRNSQGMPVGMSRHDYNSRRALPEEQKLIPHAVDSTGAVTEMLKADKTSTRARIDNESFKRVLVNLANRGIMKRPSKITRRVAAAKRSCSAMRSMVDIMERREARFSNA
jgi:adenosylmethionine-8-amino-7-oxononanoate aminotransferase